MTCPAGKDHQDLKNGQKILQIDQLILASVQEVMFVSQLDIHFYIVNKVVKQNLK